MLTANINDVTPMAHVVAQPLYVIPANAPPAPSSAPLAIDPGAIIQSTLDIPYRRFGR